MTATRRSLLPSAAINSLIDHGHAELERSLQMTARPADNQIMVEHRALGHLTPEMKGVLAGQEMVFVASGDLDGARQASLRLGPPGFVRILDDTTLMYPVYEADGRPAGGANLGEGPRGGLLFVADGVSLQ